MRLIINENPPQPTFVLLAGKPGGKYFLQYRTAETGPGWHWLTHPCETKDRREGIFVPENCHVLGE